MTDSDEVNKNQSECPDFNTLAAYLDDTLDENEKQLVDTHLKDCQHCREILDFGKQMPTSQSEVEQVPSYALDSRL